MAFGPDGRLAAGDNVSTVQVWSISAAGIPTNDLVLRGHTGGADKLAFSSDGRLLAVAGKNGTVWVWDIRTTNSRQPLALRSNSGPVKALAFSPDGHLLASAGQDGTVRVWSLDLDALITLACSTVGRNLGLDEWQQYFGQDTYHRTCPGLPIHPYFLDEQLFAASKQAQQGKITQAIRSYQPVQRSDPQFVIKAEYWGILCRAGVLRGQVKDVLDACGRAVALEPAHAGYRESRGIARALTGDLTGAIEDFEIANDIGRRSTDANGLRDTIDRSERWIRALRAGRNPFDEATLEQLRAEG